MPIPDVDPVTAPPVRLTGDGVLADVYAARYVLADRPPRLAAALAHAARALDADDIVALDYALREGTVALMATMSRIRAAYPELFR